MKQKMYFKQFRAGPRQFIFLLMAALLGLGILLMLTEYSRVTEPMSYSTFLKNIELNKVKSVHVAGQRAYGWLRDGKTRFEVVIPENNPQQWDLFNKHHVEVTLSEQSSVALGWYIGLPFVVYFFLLLLCGFWFVNLVIQEVQGAQFLTWARAALK